MNKYFNCLIFLILIIIIIVLFSVLYQKYIEKKLVINIFGYSKLLVLSGSMQPTIKQGETIIIKKEDNYNIGDIVTFNVDNKYLVTHRIIKIKEINNQKTYITKGDFNNCEDKDILYYENIEGRVISHYKFLDFEL